MITSAAAILRVNSTVLLELDKHYWVGRFYLRESSLIDLKSEVQHTWCTFCLSYLDHYSSAF